MWVNRKQHERELDLLHRTIRDLQRRLDIAEDGWAKAESRYDMAYAQTARAQQSEAAAKAYYDTARLALNELKLERAALLTRLLPGLELKIPTVTPGIVEAPGVSFEDMGDAAAKVFSDAAVIPEDPDQRPRPTDDVRGHHQLFLDPDELADEGEPGTVLRSPAGA